MIVAKFDAEFRRHAVIMVLGLRVVVGIDFARAIVRHRGQHGRGEGRERADNIGRESDQRRARHNPLRGGVLRRDVIARYEEFDVLAGGNKQSRTRTKLLRSVDPCVVESVLHVSAPSGPEQADARGDLIGQHGSGDTGTQASFAGRVAAHIDEAGCVERRLLGDDIENAGGSILAEQGALRAPQYFNPLNVQQVQCGLALTRKHDAIKDRRYGRLHAWRCRNCTQPAQEQRLILVGGRGAEVQGGHGGGNVAQVIEAVRPKQIARDHGHRNWDVLKRFGATRRGHDDLL